MSSKATKTVAALILSVLGAACTGIETLEVSAADTRAHPDDQPFVPLRDGDHLHVFVQGEGALTIGLRLRVTGSHAPSSLAQNVRVLASTGTQEAMSNSTTPCLPDPDGSRITATTWLVGLFLGDYYDPSSVVISAEGRQLSTAVHPVMFAGCSQLSRCVQSCCFGSACVSNCLGTASPTAQALFATLASCEAQACGEFPDGGGCDGGSPTYASCIQTATGQSCAASWQACDDDN